MRTELIKKIQALPEAAPITEAFEPKLRKSGVLNDGRWYSTQKEHWLGWLGDYDGPGAYGRQKWDADARAETIYNRVVNPAMVLWLGEAAGVPEAVVKKAASAALNAGDTLMSKAGAIRMTIPWSLIGERLRARRRQ